MTTTGGSSLYRGTCRIGRCVCGKCRDVLLCIYNAELQPYLARSLPACLAEDVEPADELSLCMVNWLECDIFAIACLMFALQGDFKFQRAGGELVR